MNPNPEMLNGLPGVACTGLLGCVFVMSCFIIGVIGGSILMPLFLERLDCILDKIRANKQLLPQRVASRSVSEIHFAKILQILIVSLFIFGKLLVKECLLKRKLLFEQALLEAVCHAARNPSTDQSAEQCATNSCKENIVCHKSVATQPNEKGQAHPEEKP
jgi:hypothetical protein